MDRTRSPLLVATTAALITALLFVVVLVLMVTGHQQGLICGVGTHRVVVRTPTYDYLPDECRPNP
jgi:hypothetical protein